MRYNITGSNILLEHSEFELEDIVAAAFKVLVPRIAPKLLFLQRSDENYPKLDSLKKFDSRFRVLQNHKDLRAVSKQLRIIEGHEGLTIAPNEPEKIDRAKWSSLSEEIFEKARNEEQPNKS